MKVNWVLLSFLSCTVSAVHQTNNVKVLARAILSSSSITGPESIAQGGKDYIVYSTQHWASNDYAQEHLTFSGFYPPDAAFPVEKLALYGTSEYIAAKIVRNGVFLEARILYTHLPLGVFGLLECNLVRKETGQVTCLFPE
jgi:hypothetical protein